MATENYSVRFGQQQLLIEQPAGSGIFGAPCGITGLTRTVDTNTADVELPPCDDPDAVVWLGVDETSKRMTLTFTGTLADVALPVWDAWAMDGGYRAVRWYRNLDAPSRGYWEGDALLTQYAEESTARGRYTNSGTIIWDGQPVWVGMPPAPSVTTPVVIPTTAPVDAVAFTATPGTYTGTPVLTYQWFIESGSAWVPVTGATAVAFTAATADVGKRVYVVETATNASGSVNTRSATSLPIAAA